MLSFRTALEFELDSIIDLVHESTSGLLRAVLGDAGVRQRVAAATRSNQEGHCFQVLGGDADFIGILHGYPSTVPPPLVRTPEESARDVIIALRELRRAEGWYLASLAVKADLRRRGHGMQLLDEACRCAREFGAPEIWLHVFEEKTGARALYDDAGFVERARVRLPPHPAITATSDLVLYAKLLAR